MFVQLYTYFIFFYLSFVVLYEAKKTGPTFNLLVGYMALVPIFGRVFGWF
jgi:hypothetical protein